MATLSIVPGIAERPADLIRVAVPRLNKGGRSLAGVKMMILAFMRGWEVQHELQVTFGKRGSVRFGTQAEAEKYLMALPVNYAGATRKQEDGKWLVSYHRIAALRTKLEVA